MKATGTPVDVTATTDASDQVQVYGMGAVKETVVADNTAYAGDPYHLSIQLQNISPIPVYNLSLTLDSGGSNNYLVQPNEPSVLNYDVLCPDTALAGGRDRRNVYRIERGLHAFADITDGIDSPSLIVVPGVSGPLDVADSFVASSGGEEGPKPTVSKQVAFDPSTLPSIGGSVSPTAVTLHWDAIPGAVTYQAFSTSGYSSPFSGTPVQWLSGPTASTNGTETGSIAFTAGMNYVAISTVKSDNGTDLNELDHPLFSLADSGKILSGDASPADGLCTASAEVAMHNAGCASTPVDPGSGDLSISVNDLSSPEGGVGLSLSRTFNSKEAQREGIFGYGWLSNYDMHLAVSPGGATIVDGDGSAVTATVNSNGTFTLPAWANSTSKSQFQRDLDLR